MSDPKVLLFDLGGVLVDVVWLDDLRDMLSDAGMLGDVEARYNAFEPYLHYETGLLTSDEFGAAFAAAWPLKVDSFEFLERYGRWPRGLYPGAVETLAALRGRFRLAALSNSNPLHWATIRQILPHFEQAFASYQVKLLKPDPAFYLHAARELGVEPSDICFFDDRPVNVDAARAVGMQSHVVKGIDEVRACLTKLGFLDRA